MPTGYTAKLYEGEPQDFPEFALSCARAFVAAVMMRDEAVASLVNVDSVRDTHGITYHTDALAKAGQNLVNAMTLTDDEATELAQAEYEAELQ